MIRGHYDVCKKRRSLTLQYTYREYCKQLPLGWDFLSFTFSLAGYCGHNVVCRGQVWVACRPLCRPLCRQLTHPSVLLFWLTFHSIVVLVCSVLCLSTLIGVMPSWTGSLASLPQPMADCDE